MCRLETLAVATVFICRAFTIAEQLANGPAHGCKVKISKSLLALYNIVLFRRLRR